MGKNNDGEGSWSPAATRRYQQLGGHNEIESMQAPQMKEMKQ